MPSMADEEWISLEEALSDAYPALTALLDREDSKRLMDIWESLCKTWLKHEHAGNKQEPKNTLPRTVGLDKVHITVGIWADSERDKAKERLEFLKLFSLD